MFRTIVCCAALVLVPFLGLSLNAVAAPACDDPGCQSATKSKPLNIMQFMREQAASTRAATPRQSGRAKPRQSKLQPVAHKAISVAHVQRPARRAVAARAKPAGLPTDAAASFAAQQPPVQVVASDEFNDIDRAVPATATSEETTGAASAAEPNVQLVETGEFNDIDRKAEELLRLSALARIADAQANAGQAKVAQPNIAQTNVSWLQWIWSAVGSAFTALAAAAHQLVGL
jgi:hypothetical protein